MIAPQAHQGYEYEQNAVNFLRREHKLIPRGFRPAGSNNNIPDIILEYANKQAGVELKIKPAGSAGSLRILYTRSRQPHPWHFSLTTEDSEDEDKLVLRSLAHSINLFSILERKWKHVPMLREDKDEYWERATGALSKEKQYVHDYQRFPDIRGHISARAIEEYYNKKGAYYINVGTHGFYSLGQQNPFRLRGLPRFGEYANAQYRARVQSKGGNKYYFIFELTFGLSKTSPFNIAPIQPSHGVKIIKDLANLSCFDL